jgi:hypothetical protein
MGGVVVGAVWWGVVWGGVGLLFEIWIVDASICAADAVP